MQKTGHFYPFACLQIDIAGHSRLNDTERTIHSAKDRFHRLITGLVANYGGVPLGWKGDGGAFLFPITDGHEYDEATLAALRIRDSMPSVNGELYLVTSLSQSLSVRISLDAGLAVYNANPGLITGNFLNTFLKHERAIGLIDVVSITDRVHQQFSLHLRGWFEESGHSDELGCRVYRSAGFVGRHRPRRRC
jgi:hypothetical protein